MENKNACNRPIPHSTLKSSLLTNNCNTIPNDFPGVITELPKAKKKNLIMILPKLSLSRMFVLNFWMENGDRDLNLLIFSYLHFVEIIRLRESEWNQRLKGNNNINLQPKISRREKVELYLYKKV